MEFTPLSLGILVAVLFAVFMLLRGVARILLGTLVLCVSAWVAFRAWQLAPMFSAELLGRQITWLPKAAAAIAFLITFVVGRGLARMILGPFQGRESAGPLNLRRLVSVGLLALLPTSMLGSVGAVFMNHLRLIDGLRNSVGPQSATTPEKQELSFAHSFANNFGKFIPEKYYHLLDPFSDPQRVALARELAAKPALAREIDPSTGQPIPRAIPVNDPELQSLVREQDFTNLLHSPKLTKALADPRVVDFLKRFTP